MALAIAMAMALGDYNQAPKLGLIKGETHEQREFINKSFGNAFKQ